MKRVLLALLCMLTVGITPALATDVSQTIANIASANSWNSGTQYLSWNLDSNISVARTEGGGNSGKYYSSDKTWRLYENEYATFSITAATGYHIDKYTITYSVSNTGILKDSSGETLTSGTAYNVDSPSSVSFSLGNSGSATNGQIKITEISVSYSTNAAVFTATASIQGEAGTSISVAKGNSVILNCGFTNGTLDSCQWYYNYDNDYNGEALSGETNTSLTIDTSDAEYEPGNIYYFYCYGLSEDADEASSNIIAITVTDPPYQVSFNAGNGSCGTASLTEASSGAGVTLPPATSGVAGWTFAGWATASCAQTTDAPTLYAADETYHPTANTTLYAVYSKTEASGGSTFKLSVTVDETTYYIGGQTGSNKYFDAPTDATEAVEFGIETVDASSYLYYLNGATKRYVSIASDKSDLTFSDNTSSATAFTVTESAGTISFQTTANSRYLGFNSSASPKRFAGYVNTYPHEFTKTSGTLTTYNSNPSSAVTYTVTYDANGGSGDPMTDSNSPYEAGSTVNVLENTFTKSGYNFTGWNTAADGSGTAIAADESFIINANTTLYAQWEINHYTVTWNINGSSASTEDVEYGSKVSTVPTPTDAQSAPFNDKVYMGWTNSEYNDDAAPAVLFKTVGDSPAISANTTFYAVFATADGSGASYEWIKQESVPSDSEAEYVIVGGASSAPSYNAMQASINNDRFENGTVTLSVDQGKITSEPATDVIWKIYKKDGYFRIKNGTDYAAGTSAKNQGQLSSDEDADLSKWTITYEDSKYVFHNYGRSKASSDSGNAYLRNNGTNGWACYASGTGYAPVLYKKVISTTYSDYVTTADPTALARPTITPDASSPVGAGTNVTIAVESGLTIVYTLDGSNPTDTENAASVSVATNTTTFPLAAGTVVVKAAAYNGTKYSTVKTVTYTVKAVPVQPIVFNPANGTIDYNSTITITCADADEISYQMVAGAGPAVEGDWTTVAVDANHKISFKAKMPGSVTLYAYGLIDGMEGGTSSTTYTINEPQTKVFSLVTDISQLIPDNQYIIVNNNATGTRQAVDGTEHNTLSALSGTDVEVTENGKLNIVTISEDDWDNFGIFTLREGYTSGSYALEYESGNYLYFSDSTGDKIKASATLDANTSFEITLEETVANGIWSKIKCCANNNYMRYNANSFRIYSSDIGNPIYLYCLVDLNKVMTPVIKVTGDSDAGSYYNNEVSVSAVSATSNATLKYSTDGTNWSDLGTSVKVNAPGTIYVKGIKDGLEDSDVSEVMLKFRPSLPAINIVDGVGNTKKAIITASTTVGSITEVRNPETLAWTSIDDTYEMLIVSDMSVETRVTKTGYNPATRTNAVAVTLETPIEPGVSATYDTGALNKPWSANDTEAVIENVGWTLNADLDPGNDLYLGTAYGQIGSNDKPVTKITISTNDIPGIITGFRFYVGGTAQTTGGTFTVKVGGTTVATNVPFTTSYSSEIPVICYASGPIVLEFTPTIPGAFYFRQLLIDYTPNAEVGKVLTPSLSIPSGSYLNGTKVSMSCGTTGAQIRYTTDDTTPTEESTLYEGPITLDGLVDANGDVKIIAKAFKAELTASNPVVGEYHIIEGEVFELVQNVEELTENDRFIIVNAIPMDDAHVDGVNGRDWTGSVYYAMSKTSSSSGSYYPAVPITKLKDSDSEGPAQMLITSDQDIAVITLATDGTNSDPERPYLLQCGTTEVLGEVRPTYFQAGKKKLSLVTLPDNFEDRGNMNCAIIINGTETDPDTDFTKYHFGAQVSCSDKDKGDIESNARIVFSGLEGNTTVLTNLRFNPVVSSERFNCYEYKLTDGNFSPNQSTWPIQIYRAQRVLAPSITVYPQLITVDNYDDLDPTWEPTPAGTEVQTFYNPVKIVVTENPRTKYGASLKYNWSKTEQMVPVSEEYTAVPGTGIKGAEVNFFLDAYTLTYKDLVTPTAGEYEINLKSKSNESGFMSSAFRALSNLDGDDSRSSARTIKFKTTAPVLKRIKDASGNMTGVEINRPTVFTKGATIVYTTDGTEPTVSYDENGLMTVTNGSTRAGGAGQFPHTVDLSSSETLRVGVFKYGYEPTYAQYSNLTVAPEARAVQLLELTNAGVNQIATASTLSEADLIGLGISGTSGSYTNSNRTYLTYRTAAGGKYYMLHYDEDASGNTTNLYLADVDDDAAKAVIGDPDKFKWTADYYVYCLAKDDFDEVISHSNLAAITEDVNADPNGARMYINDAGRKVRAIRNILELNENLGDGETVKDVTYYGQVLKRNGSLGTNYVEVDFTYKAGDTANESSWQEYTTHAINSISPVISLPYDLEYTPETVRDLPTEYTRETDFVCGSIASAVDGREVTGVKFHKDQFTLRHYNAVFSFRRPNVCKEISDNYNIVYDIEMTTKKPNPDKPGEYMESPLPNQPNYRCVDPLISTDDDFNKLYEFRILDVHPNEDIFPTFSINNVIFWPNDEDSDYSQFVATYSGENPGTGATEIIDPETGEVLDPATGVSRYVQTLEPKNVNTPGVFSEVYGGLNAVWEDPDNQSLGFHWVIESHSGLICDPKIDGESLASDVNEPIMYLLESYNSQYGDEGSLAYYKSDYLIAHENNHATTDPLRNLRVSQTLPEWSGKYVNNFPKVYMTPIYFFLRNPQPSVENCPALVDWEIHNQEKTTSSKAPRRAIEMPEDSQIIMVRGAESAEFSSQFIYTKVEDVNSDDHRVQQIGNDLIIPEGARLFDLNGLQIEPRGLVAGVYLVKFVDGSTLKIAVK